MSDPNLQLKQAQSIVDAALRKAEEIGVPSSVAVVDAGGHCIVKARMDGVPLVTVRMCEDKAYTAAALQEPTDDLAPAAAPGGELFGLFAAEAGRIITFGGGIPLFAGDRLVGGLGVAGGAVDDDLKVADAGLSSWRAESGEAT